MRVYVRALVVVTVALCCGRRDTVTAQLTYARVTTLQDCIEYLVKFGYLKDVSEVAGILRTSASAITRDILNPQSANPAESALKVALSAFQQYARLEVTGNFDEPTKLKMNTPRCGNKDIVQVPDISGIVRGRSKRYAASGASWFKMKLTYKITRYSETLFHPSTIKEEVGKAFEMWSNYTNLDFVQVEDGVDDPVDIELKFARLAHGDIENFDGRGITLGWSAKCPLATMTAFPPGVGIGGDIHFDDDEDWTSKQYSGTNFFHVMVHELGHALGLRHSDVEEAVMYAFARQYNPNFHLHDDDIEGIQSIYGEKGKIPMRASTQYPIITNATSSPEETTMRPRPTKPDDNSKPNLCEDPHIDAITSLKDGRVYAFRGAYAFRLDPNGKGIMHRYTDKISYVFYGVPGHVDAVATYRGKTYFFKGDQYWRFENRKIDGDFPRRIEDDFPGIPNDLDAAFAWSGDDNLYFFKGDQYWAYNPDFYPTVASNYPLPLSQWYGLPSKEIDGAFKLSDGPTYFFKGDDYWLFDDENFQVAESDPPYPRSVRVMWFGCTTYRPATEELRHGWIQRTIKKIKTAVKGHFDYKIQFIRGLFSA